MTEQSASLFPTRNLVLDLDHVWASRTQTDVIRTGALWPEAGEEEEDVEEAEGEEGEADVEEEVDVEEAGAGASWCRRLPVLSGAAAAAAAQSISGPCGSSAAVQICWSSTRAGRSSPL